VHRHGWRKKTALDLKNSFLHLESRTRAGRKTSLLKFVQLGGKKTLAHAVTTVASMVRSPELGNFLGPMLQTEPVHGG
jgi:undecaprenyl pyrophosphate synthase